MTMTIESVTEQKRDFTAELEKVEKADEAGLKLRPLSDLGHMIRSKHEEMMRSHLTTLQIGSEIGAYLIEAKKQVPRGEWLSFLADETPYTSRHAERLMYLARNAAQIAGLKPAETTIRGAVTALQAMNKAAKDTSLVRSRENGKPDVDLPEDLYVIERVDDSADLPLPDESVEFIFIDPPYGLGKDYAETSDDHGYETYQGFRHEWVKEARRILKPGGRMAVLVPIDTRWAPQIEKLSGDPKPFAFDWLDDLLSDPTNDDQPVEWQMFYRHVFVWPRGNGEMKKKSALGSVDLASAPNVVTPISLVLVVHKGPWNIGPGPSMEHDFFMSMVNGFKAFDDVAPVGGSDDGHPCRTPEEMIKRLIKFYTYPGSRVCDFFVGEGTTVEACIDLERLCYGFDRSSSFVQTARFNASERLRAKYGTDAKLRRSLMPRVIEHDLRSNLGDDVARQWAEENPDADEDTLDSVFGPGKPDLEIDLRGDKPKVSRLDDDYGEEIACSATVVDGETVFVAVDPAYPAPVDYVGIGKAVREARGDSRGGIRIAPDRPTDAPGRQDVESVAEEGRTALARSERISGTSGAVAILERRTDAEDEGRIEGVPVNGQELRDREEARSGLLRDGELEEAGRSREDRRQDGAEEVIRDPSGRKLCPHAKRPHRCAECRAGRG